MASPNSKGLVTIDGINVKQGVTKCFNRYGASEANMETSKVIAALDSDLRRRVLRALSKEPMTVAQVLQELKKGDYGSRYRETVYRALEKLLEAGLVDKSYFRNKGLCYKLTMNRITIDLTTDSINQSQAR